MSELADIEYFKELCAQSVLPSEYAAVRKEFAEMIQKVILAAKREAFEEAIDACAEQGVVQEPDNPYLEDK